MADAEIVVKNPCAASRSFAGSDSIQACTSLARCVARIEICPLRLDIDARDEGQVFVQC